jgi:ribonuclease P protein subunit POP4
MMPIKPENILRHELIGLKTVVSKSSNRFLAGIRGQVADETRNTIKIDTKKGPRVIPKDVAIFRFKLPDGSTVEVDGPRLVGRPENRMKTRTRKW